MKKIIFLLLSFVFLLLSFNCFSQVNKLGLPFMKYYSPKEYNAHALNWAVAQDKRGIMYFGNNANGILEYDGTSWRQIEIPNNLIVRSLAVDNDGKIYVGAVGEFGFLMPDQKGKLNYKSLSARLDTSKIKMEDIWKTYCETDAVYFCTPFRIYKYQPGKSIIILDLPKESFLSFLINNQLYVGNYKKGLLVFKNNNLQEANVGVDYAKKDINVMLPYDKENILIGTSQDGLFIYNMASGNSTSLGSPDNASVTNDLIKQNALYCGIIYNDGFALGTLNNGVYIINKQGEITQHLTKKTGLPFETVTFAFNNTENNFSGNIWLSLSNGISKAEINSPLRRLDSEFGLAGDVNAVARFKGVLYFATATGIFYLEYNKNNEPVFIQIPRMNNTALSFLIFKTPKGEEKLLAGTSGEIFEIQKNGTVSLGTNFVCAVKMIQSKKNPELIYVAAATGLKVRRFNQKQEKWEKADTIKEITEEMLSLVEDNEGNIWASSLLNGIYRIDPNRKVKHFGKNDGLLSLNDIEVNIIDNQLIFATPNGFYKYDIQTDRFIAYNGFGKKYSNGKTQVFHVQEGYNGKYWLSLINGNNKWIETITKQKDGTYKTDSVPFKRFPNMSLWTFYNEPDGITWLGTSEGLFTYDNNFTKNYSVKYNAQIRNITIGEDSILFYGTFFNRRKIDKGPFAFDSLNIFYEQTDELKPTLKYKYNNLTFIYSAPYFEDEGSTLYSHYLEGNDEGWSKWTKETKAIYTNLYEGKYTFHVKAKNVFGVESKITSYQFTVKPPWYRTIWAYISYVILLILFIWAIVAIATYRMKQLNIAYGRYLPGSFLKLLDKARVIDLRLGDLTEKEVTIMFSDIRSYTNLSESMSPHDNFRFLVSYLGKIGDMLHQNTGFPVQYYGDGIMAMFHGDTDYAVQAAVDMHNKVAEYSVERKTKERRELHIGVGLHTGKIVMGIRGDARRWEGGIVGDSVNLASRMEGLTKMYGASTIMSDDTFTRLKNPKRFNIRFLGKVKVKGKDIPVGIYELLDGNDKHIFEIKMKTKTHFDAALDYFFEKDIEKAKDLFHRVLEVNPDDIAAQHYFELIKHYLVEGIPADFDGVEKLDKK
ncbi:MAG: hypothetical protein HY958_00170 [Bacteroidia bacterium]|nr:hypothetical protein [Bacteroidia bacterium]